MSHNASALLSVQHPTKTRRIVHRTRTSLTSCHPEARVFRGLKDLCTPSPTTVADESTDPSARKTRGLQDDNFVFS